MKLIQLKLSYIYPYCGFHTKKELHSGDTTALIGDLISCTTPAFFRTFLNLQCSYYGKLKIPNF